MKQLKDKLYLRLLGYIKQYGRSLLLAALGNVVYASVDSYFAYLFKPILDKGLIGNDHFFLTMLPLIILVLFIIKGVGSFVSTYFMGLVGRRVVFNFRLIMFKQFLFLPAKYFDDRTTGQLLSKLIYDVDQVTQATGSTLTTFVRQGCFIIGLLIVMFVINWRLTLFIFIIAPFIMLIVTYVSKRFRRLSHRIQNGVGDVTHAAEESIQGYREVRIYGGQSRQYQCFNKTLHYNFIQEMKVIFTDALSSPIIQLIAVSVLSMIIYFAVNSKHSISPGDFVSFITAMALTLKPIKDLTSVNSSIQKGLAAAQSIFELIDEPVEADKGKKNSQTC